MSRDERELGAAAARAAGARRGRGRGALVGGRPRRLRGARAPLRPSRRTRRLALALAGGAVALAIGLSPAGAKVGDLVADVRRDRRAGREAGAALAAGGGRAAGRVPTRRLDGRARTARSGCSATTTTATWSPNGVYVAATNGRELVALEPDGDVRWTYTAPGEVRDPRWAGTAVDTRIAYRSGDDLRVIAGDGSGDTDHLIARDVAPVAPAWRPVGESKLDRGRRRSGRTCSATSTASGTVRTRRRRHRRARADDPATACGSIRALGRAHAATEDRALSPDGSRDSRRSSTSGAATGCSSPGAAAAREVLFSAPRRPHRPDLVAGRPLAAGRLAGGRPVAVHRRRAAPPRGRLRPDLGAVRPRRRRRGPVPARRRLDAAGALSRPAGSVRAERSRDTNICSWPTTRPARGPPARADRARDRVAGGADHRRLGPLARAGRRVRPPQGLGRAPAVARPASGSPGAARSRRARRASTSASRGRCASCR